MNTTPSHRFTAAAKVRGLQREIVRAPLEPRERAKARDVWVMHLGSQHQVAESLGTLLELLDLLQVPLQPVIRAAVDASWSKHGANFTFDNFVVLLERCKALHMLWLRKIRGRRIDDELLEAYVAVGGEADASGTVDVEKIAETLSTFQLKLPELRGVHDSEHPVGFAGFVEMLSTDGSPAAAELSRDMYLKNGDLESGEHCTPAASGSRPSSRLGPSRRGSFRRGSGAVRLPPLPRAAPAMAQHEAQRKLSTLPPLNVTTATIPRPRGARWQSEAKKQRLMALAAAV